MYTYFCKIQNYGQYDLWYVWHMTCLITFFSKDCRSEGWYSSVNPLAKINVVVNTTRWSAVWWSINTTMWSAVWWSISTRLVTMCTLSVQYCLGVLSSLVLYYFTCPWIQYQLSLMIYSCFFVYWWRFVNGAPETELNSHIFHSMIFYLKHFPFFLFVFLICMTQ